MTPKTADRIALGLAWCGVSAAIVHGVAYAVALAGGC